MAYDTLLLSNVNVFITKSCPSCQDTSLEVQVHDVCILVDADPISMICFSLMKVLLKGWLFNSAVGAEMILLTVPYPLNKGQMRPEMARNV